MSAVPCIVHRAPAVYGPSGVNCPDRWTVDASEQKDAGYYHAEPPACCRTESHAVAATGNGCQRRSSAVGSFAVILHGASPVLPAGAGLGRELSCRKVRLGCEHDALRGTGASLAAASRQCTLAAPREEGALSSSTAPGALRRVQAISEGLSPRKAPRRCMAWWFGGGVKDDASFARRSARKRSYVAPSSGPRKMHIATFGAVGQ